MHAEVARTLIREFAIKVRTSMACPIIQNFSHDPMGHELTNAGAGRLPHELLRAK